MVMFSKGAGTGTRPHWLTVATCAVGLVLAPYVVMAGTGGTTVPAPQGATGQTGTGSATTGTPAAADVQSLNSSLTVEQLLAQFYNQNSNKGYLTATTPVTNPTTGTTTGTTAATTGTTANTTTGTTANTTGTTADTTGTTANTTTGPQGVARG
jgi:hypothetical protein